jgi:dephospho-CoA kinase
LQEPITYTVVLGKPLAGKTFISNILAKHLEFKIVDVKAVEEIVKKKLGSEEEPFEGTPPIDKIEDEILSIF